MEKNKDEFGKELDKQDNKSRSSDYISKDPLSDTLKQNKNSHKLVLILEDNEQILNMYLRMLNAYNHDKATSLKEAYNILQQLKEKGVELAVLIADFHLPDGDSTEFVKAAKQQFPNMRVILSSSDESAKEIVSHDVYFEKRQIIEIKSKVDEYLST